MRALLAIALVAAFTAPTAAPATAQDTKPDIASEIRQADQNGDGAVSRDELFQSRIPVLRRRLTEMAEKQIQTYDTNGDGALTASEIANTRVERLRRLWTRRFNAIDTDGNGRISQRELERLQSRLNK